MTAAPAYFPQEHAQLEPMLSGRALAHPPSSFLRGWSQATLISRERQVFVESGDFNEKIEVGDASPTWMEEAAQSLTTILNLEENWDSYGARRVTLDGAIAALTVLFNVMGDRTPMPAIIPTPSGNVQLEWHQFGIDLEVEITPSGRFSIFYEDEIESYEDESPSRSIRYPEVLLDYVNRITQRTDCHE